MADFRQTPKAKQTVTLNLGGTVYYCMHCGVDRFVLFPSGTIGCANCGAVMRNIQVSESGNIKNSLM
jgi:hypothetical protein